MLIKSPLYPVGKDISSVERHSKKHSPAIIRMKPRVKLRV